MSASPSLGTEDIARCQKALTSAGLLLLDYSLAPFLSTILYGMKTQITDEVKTIATDGLNLYVNPHFFLRWDQRKQIGLLAHEAKHVAFEHVLVDRMGTRDPEIWNWAADYVINPPLKDFGFDLPPGLCEDRYRNMTTEAVYDDLVSRIKKQEISRNALQAAAGEGSGEDIKIAIEVPNNHPDADNAQDEIKNLILRAVTAQKMQDPESFGKLPGEIVQKLEELIRPKKPWYSQLRQFMAAFHRNDYSYRRPSRRYLPDFYMPTLYSEGMGRIAFGIDVSGSTYGELFQKFICEIHFAQRTLMPEATDIISWDTRITSVHSLTDFEQVQNVEFTGGGGTNVMPLLEWGEVSKNKPEVMVILTDGEFRMPSFKPSYPVVWVIYDNDDFKPPFGKVIYIDI
jgi:predicted metal-dependent peptidase